MDSEQKNPDNDIDLADAYAVVTPHDNKSLYAKWARSYDISFVDANRYRYPRAIAEHFVNTVPKSDGESYVDVGCGTGFVGAHLTSLRPTCRVDGIDISPQMLVEAGRKLRDDLTPVYSVLIEADLTQPLRVPNDNYDALLSAGTFTHGHLGPEVIQVLLSLVRIGGWFVIGINAEHFASRGFADMLSEITRNGYITQPDFHKIQVYEEGSQHFGDQAEIATFRRVN